MHAILFTIGKKSKNTVSKHMPSLLLNHIISITFFVLLLIMFVDRGLSKGWENFFSFPLKCPRSLREKGKKNIQPTVIAGGAA